MAAATVAAPALSAASKRRLNTRAFRHGRWHRDSVLAALDALRSTLAGLPDNLLADLAWRGQYTATPDGFPVAPGRERVSGGGSGLTSVEAAVDRRLDGHSDRDPAGAALADLFAALARMSDLAADVDRLVPYLVHLADDRRGRVTSLQTDCLCCDRPVSGAVDDRLRRGLCGTCYARWRRQDRPDIARFVVCEREHREHRPPAVVDAR